MKLDKLDKMSIVIGIWLSLIVIIIVLVNQPVQSEPEKEIDFSGIYERFDRIETGIVNSSVDFCFSNGGTYLTDPNGNIVTQESQFLDQNTGQTRIVRFIPCVLE